MQQPVRLVIAFLMLALLACTFTPPETEDVPPRTELANRINRTRESYQQARALWDQVIFAETSVSCGVRIDVPEFSPPELPHTTPQSATIQYHLNEALNTLRAVAAIWETECQLDRTQIPIETLRQVESLLQFADEQLYQAALRWNEE